MQVYLVQFSSTKAVLAATSESEVLQLVGTACMITEATNSPVWVRESFDSAGMWGWSTAYNPRPEEQALVASTVQVLLGGSQ